MPGLRATARALDIDHAQLKRLADMRQVPRNADGSFDVEATRAALKRNIDPAFSRKKPRRKGGDSASRQSPRRHQSPAVVTSDGQEPLSPDAERLMSILTETPALLAWDAATPGDTTQRAFDLFTNMRMNIASTIRHRGFVVENEDFEEVDWPGLAEEMGLTLIDPNVMAADWQRRYDAD